MIRLLGVAAAVLLGSLAVDTESRAAGAPSRAEVAVCFESRRVLVDPGASVYLPRSVVPRSRQLALSFVFVPADEVPGVVALVALSATPAAAARTRARMIRFATRGRAVPRSVLRRAFELRSTSVVFWHSGEPQAFARRVATRCLGPRTA